MTMSAARTTIAWLIAVGMGFGCSMLLALIMMLFRFDPAGADKPAGDTILLGLVLGWALSTWLLIRRAQRISEVLQRGFLVGAIAWIVFGIMISRLEQQIPPDPNAAVVQSRASWEPAAPLTLRGPAGAAVARAGAFTMAGACLVGWGIVFAAARFLQRRTVQGGRPVIPAGPDARGAK